MTGPGDDGRAHRLPDSVRISIAHLEEEAEELSRIFGKDVACIGGYHSHPRPVRTPSETDRSSALQALDEVSALRWAPYWVDLILIADKERGWDSPRAVGWVTRRNEWGRAVTEPARIIGAR